MSDGQINAQIPFEFDVSGGAISDHQHRFQHQGDSAPMGATDQTLARSPGTVGLYQVNVQTPPDLPSGDATVTVTQGDTSSNTVTLPAR